MDVRSKESCCGVTSALKKSVNIKTLSPQFPRSLLIGAKSSKNVTVQNLMSKKRDFVFVSPGRGCKCLQTLVLV